MFQAWEPGSVCRSHRPRPGIAGRHGEPWTCRANGGEDCRGAARQHRNLRRLSQRSPAGTLEALVWTSATRLLRERRTPGPGRREAVSGARFVSSARGGLTPRDNSVRLSSGPVAVAGEREGRAGLHQRLPRGGHARCGFRAKWARHSEACGPPVPIEVGHPFRGMWARHSEEEVLSFRHVGHPRRVSEGGAG